jgi:outer membrane immunogenic protein
MFKRVVLTAVAVAGMSAAAMAADMPVKGPVYKAAPAAFNWSGVYVGATIGYGWSSSAHEDTGLFIPAFDMDGVVGGVTLGVNRQVGRIVYGLEADFSGSGIKGNSTSVFCGGSCVTELEWFGTIRGRLGVTMSPTLLYITGGLAYGRLSASIGNPVVSSGSSTEFGWTVGAGVEHAFNRHWSIKAEYLYVDLGSSFRYDAINACLGASPGCQAFYDGFSIVRMGLNYRW